jgi:hypothetical protein
MIKQALSILVVASMWSHLASAVSIDRNPVITVGDKEFRNFSVELFTSPIPPRLANDFFFQPRAASDVDVRGVSFGVVHGLDFTGKPGPGTFREPLFVVDAPANLRQFRGEPQRLTHMVTINYDVRTTNPNVQINEVRLTYDVDNPLRRGTGGPVRTIAINPRDPTNPLLSVQDPAAASHSNSQSFPLPQM